ncbi:restriction endonuclease [Pontibacter pudoricolor]|uniref:restriction endonuclease n=1 Tax=Pontibacter pudoricolor TaxID=2694930 RepID=UPI00192EB23C|nr:restriction endonuclease [Pontibacter pudoricolor]
MDIPKFDETFLPILEILKTDKILKTRDLIDEVKTRFYSELTEDQLKQKTKSGDLLIDNRIAWGKSYLKKGGYVFFPERGYVQITEKGKSHSASLTVRDLENESSLFNFYKQEAPKSLSNAIPEANLSSPQDLIDEGVKRIDDDVKIELLTKLKGTNPYFFEKVVLRLLKKMGYGEYIETAKSGDGGIDGIINEDQLGLDKIYIQAKRFNDGKVRETNIRNFIGAMSGDTNKGVFVTTSEFDSKALEKARSATTKLFVLMEKSWLI